MEPIDKKIDEAMFCFFKQITEKIHHCVPIPIDRYMIVGSYTGQQINLPHLDIFLETQADIEYLYYKHFTIINTHN